MKDIWERRMKISEISDVRGSLARRQMTQHQPDGNACSLDPWLPAEDFPVAHDVLFPWHGHAPILPPFPATAKAVLLLGRAAHPKTSVTQKTFDPENYSSRSGSSRMILASMGWNWNHPAIGLP